MAPKELEKILYFAASIVTSVDQEARWRDVPKLRGEMPPDLMYGCGGDRNFFQEWNLDGADFLRAAWLADFDPAALARWVRGGPLGQA